MRYEFDWRQCTYEDIDEVMNMKNTDRPEDDIYGFVTVKTSTGKYYIADIHYYYYSAKDKGFDVEVYASDETEKHVLWLEGNTKIHSTHNYKRFCRRVEDVVIGIIQGGMKHAL